MIFQISTHYCMMQLSTPLPLPLLNKQKKKKKKQNKNKNKNCYYMMLPKKFIIKLNHLSNGPLVMLRALHHHFSSLLGYIGSTNQGYGFGP